MYRLSPRSRGQRSNKGFKVKHALQLTLLLGVGIWLVWQMQRSYNKGKTFDDGVGEGTKVSERLQDGADRLRLGRKDLPEFEETSNGNERNKVEEEEDQTHESEDEEGNDEREAKADEGREEEREVSKEGEGENKESENKDIEGEKTSEEGKTKEKEKENGGKDSEENKEKENEGKDSEENKADEKKDNGKESGNEGKENANSDLENKENYKEDRGAKEGSEENKGEEAVKGEGQEKETVEGSSEKRSEETETMEHKKENDSSSAETNALANPSEKGEIVESSNKEINKEAVDPSEDKHANTTAFSDETFVSVSQNETAENTNTKEDISSHLQEVVSDKTESGATQLDANADALSKTGDTNTSAESGDSTAFTDTNGNQDPNVVDHPESNSSLGSSLSSSGTNEKTESDHHGQVNSHNSNSQEKKEELSNNSNLEEKKEEPSNVNDNQIVGQHEQQVESPNSSDSQGQKQESNPNDNAKLQQHEQVESLNKESEKHKEGSHGHDEGDSSVTQDAKDRTDLHTLPDSGNGSNGKDAIAK